MEYQIRTATATDLEPYFSQMSLSFHYDVGAEPDQMELRRKLFDHDNNIVAVDGETIVATAGNFKQVMRVNGGDAGCAGLTQVTVRASHRRKGVLTAMMRKHLDMAHERGDELASLWASESIIYGRFGYGLATDGVDFTIDRRNVALKDEAAGAAVCRFVETEDVVARWPAIWDAVRQDSPGMPSRSADWWEHRIAKDPPWQRDGFTGARWVACEEAGQLTGYLIFRAKHEQNRYGLPKGAARVDELMSTTADAYKALWQFAFSVDLIETVTARTRRTDEPLRWMLQDPRRLQRTPGDALWLRLVDLPRALAARRYIEEDDLVLDVRDPFCPWNEDRWLLSGGPLGAVVSPTTQDAHVSLEADALAAAYLGGVSFETLQRAGRVHGEPRAIRRLDAMFRWHRAPWCPEHF